PDLPRSPGSSAFRPSATGSSGRWSPKLWNVSASRAPGSGPQRGGARHAEADRSLSDTRLETSSSTFPTIPLRETLHRADRRQLLIALTDALIRVGEQPTLDVLYRLFRLLSAEAVGIRRSYGTLFGARSFRDLGLLAAGFVRRERG